MSVLFKNTTRDWRAVSEMMKLSYTKLNSMLGEEAEGDE